MSAALTPRLALMLTLPPLLWAGNAVVGRLMVALGRRWGWNETGHPTLLTRWPCVVGPDGPAPLRCDMPEPPGLELRSNEWLV